MSAIENPPRVHPLVPLSAEEIDRAVATLRRERGVDERWRFASIELKEPAKAAFRQRDRVDREGVDRLLEP